MADLSTTPGEEVDYSHEGDGTPGEDEAGSAEQLEELQQMLSEMEESQTKIAEASNQASAQASTALAAKAKLEEQKQQRDERSVFVQNVDFKTTGEELMAFFQPCGSVERVTILADKFGHPKGCVARSIRVNVKTKKNCDPPPPSSKCSFAYVEFNDKAAVENALVLSGTAFKDRPLKIITKRTNVPSFQLRGRGGRGGARGRGSFYAPRGGGYAPRGRGGGGYYNGPRGGGFRGRGRGRGY
jgi:polyadenylate-binding protein 2